MTRTITASAVALSIAISGFAAPAQAGKNDIGKFVAGAATLFIISKVVQEDKRRRRAAAAIAARPAHIHTSTKQVHVPHPPIPAPLPVYQTPVYQPPVYQAPVYQEPVEFQGFLPTECFFEVRRGDKSRGVYSKLCLGELTARAEALPAVCEDRVTTSNGRRTQIYDSLCLQARGYADEDGQYN